MMLKVKRFLYTYINSIIPEDLYYHKLSRVPYAFSIRYFVAVVFFTYILLLVSGILKTNFFEDKRQFMNNLIFQVKAYPDDLVIDIKNGKLMSNYSQPYFLWVAEGDKQHLLAVVDETGSAEKIKMYRSLVLLTADSFTFYNGARYVSVPYGKEEWLINKEAMIKTGKALDNVYGICKVILTLLSVLVLPLLITFLSFVFCNIVAAMSYVAWKTFPQKANKHISYHRILQLSFHAVTLPLLLVSAMVLFDVPLLRLPFTFMVLLMIFTNTAVYESFIDAPPGARK